jgi:xanthine dehydrogenase YagT iron-sulfur-binding subunit
LTLNAAQTPSQEMHMKRNKPARPDAPVITGITRRTFFKSCGAGTVALTIGARANAGAQETQSLIRPAGEMTPVTLNVNGKSRQLLVEPRWTLLFVLREKLGLTAAKAGCERGECGACSVLIDDVPQYACLTLALEAGQRRIETAEGLMDGERLGTVQQGFLAEDGFQCGYCTPGQVVAAEGLLRSNPDPSFEEIRTGMSGNLCRCGAYAHIFSAVADAARRRKD